jgi:two-component system, LuxR family, sensor kinase FixL
MNAADVVGFPPSRYRWALTEWLNRGARDGLVMHGNETVMHGNEQAASPNSICPLGSSLPVRLTRAAWSAAAACGLLLIWVLLDWTSFIHSYKGSLITPWDPGVGILFAVIVRGGIFHGLPLFVGVVCAEFIVRQAALGVPVTLVSAAIIASTYTTAAMIARYHFAIEVELVRLRDIVILILTGMSGALVVAILLSLLLIVDGRFDVDDFFPSTLRSFVGDLIGIAVVSPLTLRLWYLRRQLTPARVRSVLPEAVVYAVLIAAGLWVILDTSSQHGSNFFYLLFLPVIMAAVRQGFDGACISLLATQIGLVLLLQRYSFDAETFTEFQTLMFVLTATALSVGAIVSEREQARRAFQDAEERLKRKEADAIRAGRFSLVSAMASALAHEINQPITAARALARSVQHIMRGASPDLPRADHNLATLVTQIDTAGNIVRRIREFLQRGPLMGDVDVRGLLEDVVVLIGPEVASVQVRVDLAVEDDLPPLRGDRGQLEQVLLNLVRNSIDAIAGAGMRAGRVGLSAQRSGRPCDLMISVRDNGPGISADIAARLFEPLTTSKRDGLGLGLSICGSIAAAHGGRIWLETTGTDVTEFRLMLPFKSVGPS